MINDTLRWQFSSAYAGRTVYAIARRPDGQCWEPSGVAYSVRDDMSDVADYAISAVVDAVGHWLADVPDNLPSGYHDFDLFLQLDDGGPLYTDKPEGKIEGYWDGVQLIDFPLYEVMPGTNNTRYISAFMGAWTFIAEKTGADATPDTISVFGEDDGAGTLFVLNVDTLDAARTVTIVSIPW